MMLVFEISWLDARGSVAVSTMQLTIQQESVNLCVPIQHDTLINATPLSHLAIKPPVDPIRTLLQVNMLTFDQQDALFVAFR